MDPANIADAVVALRNSLDADRLQAGRIHRNCSLPAEGEVWVFDTRQYSMEGVVEIAIDNRARPHMPEIEQRESPGNNADGAAIRKLEGSEFFESRCGKGRDPVMLHACGRVSDH